MTTPNPVSKQSPTQQLSHIITDDSQGTTSEGRHLMFSFLKNIGIMAFCGWLYASPYLALTNIREAAGAGNTEALSELMDSPSVRESLKQEIKAATVLGFLPGVDLFIDVVVTPENIAALILGQMPRLGKLEIRPDYSALIQSFFRGFLSIDRSDTHMGYEGLSKFALRYKDAKTGNDAIVVFLKRNGMSWQVSAIRLPVLR